MSPLGTSRLEHAIVLYSQGVAPKLVVVGGDSNGEGIEAIAMRDYLVRRGIPEAVILLEPRSRDTSENISNLVAMMGTNGLHSVHVVTSSFHSARVTRLLDEHAIVYSLDFPPEDLAPTAGLDHFSASTWVLREYLAFLWFDMFVFRDSATIVVLSLLVVLWSAVKDYDWIRYNLIWVLRWGHRYRRLLARRSSELAFETVRAANRKFARPHMALTRRLRAMKWVGSIAYQLFRFPTVQMLLAFAASAVVARAQSPALAVSLFAAILISATIQAAVRVANRMQFGRFADTLDDSVTWTQAFNPDRPHWFGRFPRLKGRLLTIVDLGTVIVLFAALALLNQYLQFPEKAQIQFERHGYVLATLFAIALPCQEIARGESAIGQLIGVTELILIVVYVGSHWLRSKRARAEGIWANTYAVGERPDRGVGRRVFLSHSPGDDVDHQRWIASLAMVLEDEGYIVHLDLHDFESKGAISYARDAKLPPPISPDGRLFMEQLRSADRLVIVWSARFAERASNSQTGVGYEMELARSVLESLRPSHIVVIVRAIEGDFVLPEWLAAASVIDFRSSDSKKHTECYVRFLDALSTGLDSSPEAMK